MVKLLKELDLKNMNQNFKPVTEVPPMTRKILYGADCICSEKVTVMDDKGQTGSGFFTRKGTEIEVFGYYDDGSLIDSPINFYKNAD